MAITVTLNGADYTIPSPGEANDWGARLNAFFEAIPDAIAAGGGGGTGAFGGVVTNYTNTTNTAEVKTLVTIPVTENSLKTVIVTATCNATDVGDGAGGTYSGTMCTSRGIINPAGTLLYRGSVWDIIVNSGSGWLAYADITANALTVKIEQTEAALTNITWAVRVEIITGSP